MRFYPRSTLLFAFKKASGHPKPWMVVVPFR